MIADQIRDYLLEHSEKRVVQELRIGLTYTGVLLDDGSAGVAYTFKDDIPAGCSIFGGSHPLAGRPAHEIIRYVGSTAERGGLEGIEEHLRQLSENAALQLVVGFG